MTIQPRFSLLGLLCALLATALPGANAAYTVAITSGESSRRTVALGESFELDIRIGSDGFDLHDSAILRVVFSAPGLVYQSYAWFPPYHNGTGEDDSKPLLTKLPLRLDAGSLVGVGYPSDLVDLELSNVTGGRDKFASGTLVRLRLVVPQDYGGPDIVRVQVEPDTIANGFSVVEAFPDREFHLLITNRVTKQTVLVPAVAAWKFQADGSDQGGAWRNLGFNDSSWATGEASFGFGGSGDQTTIPSGPSNNKWLTAYFRHSFVAPIVANDRVVHFRLLRDDGAAVYLNGTEVLRSNLPTGILSSSTPALAQVAGPAETQLRELCLPPGTLFDGTNVVAVEIHLASPQSTELHFAFELAVDVIDPPGLRICQAPTSMMVYWRDQNSGLILEQADILGNPTPWSAVTNAILQGGATRAALLSQPVGNKFYRLRSSQ